VLGCSFSAARIPGATDILYIGTGLFHPLGVSLASGARVVALDPLSGEVNVVDADRFIRKRHAIVEKGRDAPVFGIIVSRKPGQNRYALAQRLTSLGRTAFIVFMDEVSPAELLNLGFPAYVNTACPRLAYDDQIRFPVPVLTPLEFEILCGLRSWDEYRMDEI
jgi:2-(3-amino-3-carboxypropyl)histidine synthase